MWNVLNIYFYPFTVFLDLYSLTTSYFSIVFINQTIDIELKTVDEKLFLILSDNGIGISPNLREKLLIQRFNTFKKRGEGSGLCMWLINQLAYRYGWKFSIESRIPNNYSNGTTFNFEISTWIRFIGNEPFTLYNNIID